MTTIISKDRDWLKDEIESGIQGFFDNEGDYFVNLIMKYVLEQIYLSGVSINSESDNDDPAILRIELRIPNPDKCCDIMGHLSTKSVHQEDWPEF